MFKNQDIKYYCRRWLVFLNKISSMLFTIVVVVIKLETNFRRDYKHIICRITRFSRDVYDTTSKFWICPASVRKKIIKKINKKQGAHANKKTRLTKHIDEGEKMIDKWGKIKKMSRIRCLRWLFMAVVPFCLPSREAFTYRIICIYILRSPSGPKNVCRVWTKRKHTFVL